MEKNMYHVSNDIRSKKSAELIWQGMEKCLLEKSLDKVRITDIHQKSLVSRATFYRLFDSVQDVIAYECDCIYFQLAENMQASHFNSRQEIFLFLIEEWLKQDTLIKTLVENNMISIIYDTHMKNHELLKQLFLEDISLSDREADYLVSILANIIPATVNTWYLHGRTETPKEIYLAVTHSLTIISKQLSKKK